VSALRRVGQLLINMLRLSWWQRAHDTKTLESLTGQVASTLGGLKTLQFQMATLKHDSEAKLEGHLEARERLVSDLEAG
jgi:hypothetical protein